MCTRLPCGRTTSLCAFCYQPCQPPGVDNLHGLFSAATHDTVPTRCVYMCVYMCRLSRYVLSTATCLHSAATRSFQKAAGQLWSASMHTYTSRSGRLDCTIGKWVCTHLCVGLGRGWWLGGVRSDATCVCVAYAVRSDAVCACVCVTCAIRGAFAAASRRTMRPLLLKRR